MSETILAADKISIEKCEQLGPSLGPRLFAIKVHVLIEKHGLGVIRRLKRAGWQHVWADAKLHDIPETVYLRAKELSDAGADIISVHAEGEIEMMMAARESGANIFAITVLTSLDEEQTHLATGQPVRAAVLYRARLAKLAGVEGIVCSPHEVKYLAGRPELKGLDFATPGIRLLGGNANDQKRFDTPDTAAENGSTYQVIGRALTEADDPIAAYEHIQGLIEAGKAKKDRKVDRTA